jgi:hypothetical protein
MTALPNADHVGFVICGCLVLLMFVLMFLALALARAGRDE